MIRQQSENRGFPLAAAMALHKGKRAEAVRFLRQEWGIDAVMAESAVDEYLRSNLGGGLARTSVEPADMLRNPVFIRALVLDSVGGIAVALGLAAKFAHVDVLPPPLRFENYEWALIGGGVLLMLPMVFYFLKRAQGQGR